MHHPIVIETLLKAASIATLSAGLLMISGCSEEPQEAVEVMETPQEDTAEVVVETTEAGSDGEGTAEEATAQEDQSAWDKTKEASKNAWDKTKAVTEETWDKTKEEAAKEPIAEDAQKTEIEDR